MFDTHTLYPHKSSPARPSSQRNLLRRSSRPQARRPKSRFQRGASDETLLGHQDAEPRRLSRRDRSTAAPPTADDHTNLRQGRYQSTAHYCHAVDGRCVMSALRTAFHDYLAVRRALGYKLRLEGRMLSPFVDFVDRSGAQYITTELARNSATQPVNAQPSQWANRLAMVRRFARYCLPSDPRTLVPPPDLLPHHYRRVAPYIYSDEEIIRLLKAARQLPSTIGLRPHTYATLFGLYVATGLRANEALCLRREDVDLANGVLTIRASKFGKTRFVPVHLSTWRALERYAKLRDRLCRTPASPRFFL